VAGSNPLGTVFAALGLAAVFLVVGTVPALRAASGAGATLPCLLLSLLGGALTYTAYREGGRGTLGALATLLDNGCYATAMSLAAITTRGSFSIGFAVVQTLVVLAFPASVYGFSLLLWLGLSLPTLLLLLWHPPEVATALILIASCAMSGAMLTHTAKRRELQAKAKRLHHALGATDQMLDVAMQRALGSTLLGLGHFLHELKNQQSVVRLNLELLEAAALGPAQREAVKDALDAVHGEQALLEETLDDLRRQSDPRQGGVLITSAVLERALQGHPGGLQLEYSEEAPGFEVQGEATHLSAVLRNLLRNASEAGATRLSVQSRLEPSGRAVLITLSDDGPGIASEGKPSGTGLGLYLCRRYVELMGGEISVESQLGRGARFTLRLPGAPAPALAAPSRLAQPAVSAS
jgi:signal transduction histidine kinase